jgi:superoxide dismutase, Fe-Mn family
VTKDFGSFEAFRAKFDGIAAGHFASGWVALALHRASNKLFIAELKDHEVLNPTDSTAIFILDVWEHAYYVKYQNRRPEFIAAFWNVVDWRRAEANFTSDGAGDRV